MDKEEELLNEQEVAEILKIKPATLAQWRCLKRFNLPYFKIGKLVRYKAEDLKKWIENRGVTDGKTRKY